MKKSLLELLEKMSDSRGALERQWDQLAKRPSSGALPFIKATATPKRVGIAVGLALALAVFFPRRRRR